MKIREIRATGLRGSTPKGGWTNELQPNDCIHTLITVLTDEGLTGWGSASTSEELARASLSTLRPLYYGENPLEPERVSEVLHQNTFWLGRGGAITQTISGIDIALWDILGKATGQPIGRLLGGCYRQRVRPYGSILMQEPQAMADELLPVKERGFRAFKMGWGPFGRRDAATDEAIVRAARDAVGPECQLMVDAGASDCFWQHGYNWAVQKARMLVDYDVVWFEEPLPPDNLQDYVALRRKGLLPIAGGEVLTRRQSFQPWLEAGAFDIVQPDVTKVGGLSESRRIGWMARGCGTRLIPHGWNTAVGLAADLQLASAFPDTDFVEYLTGSPFVDELVEGGWHLEADGTLAIPEGPGLGIQIDEDALARYSGLKRVSV
ncbi:MAG: mandelate racemase/muconate lactonizing enzyme family protein [Terriglobia bacterium]